ncbi:winged helix-turn-helix domain-containing protein [Rahnella contaminans]|uniref:winged helix-turn-helix domain-containing protein n=1 Tax=Rahnella contaminans TaxID=2703882 RepID=UPI003C2E8CC9
MMNKERLFGYSIGNNIIVDIQRNIVFGIIHGKKIQAITLRTTMMRLLIYMLETSGHRIVSNNEIMIQVWENHQLSASSQRLWQVMRELKKKLSLPGLPEEFIMRIESKGYFLKCVDHESQRL